MNDTAADPTPRPGTTHPHLARERALKLLFAADVRGVDPRLLLDEVAARPADLELLDELEPDEEQVAGDEELQVELGRRRRMPVDDYTRTLVDGVASHRPSIDLLLGEVADRWQVQRMPVVDRNLLRLAVYELAEQDTPAAVVIDEAVSLAIAFAGEKARGFVNGVLETVRQRLAAGEAELVPAPTATSATDLEAVPDGEVADVDEEDVAESMTSAHVAEVDAAAQEAYDLALDLLDAAGPLEDPGPEDLGPEDLADEEDPVRDEDDALW